MIYIVNVAPSCFADNYLADHLLAFQTDALYEFSKPIGNQIIQSSPKDSYFVALGRSPTAIAAYIRATGAPSMQIAISGVPFWETNLKKLAQDIKWKPEDIRSALYKRLIEYFKHSLPPKETLAGKTLVFYDYVNMGSTLSTIKPLIEAAVRDHAPDTKVKFAYYSESQHPEFRDIQYIRIDDNSASKLNLAKVLSEVPKYDPTNQKNTEMHTFSKDPFQILVESFKRFKRQEESDKFLSCVQQKL